MRDPKHPEWPDKGERTADEEVANTWVGAYWDLVRGKHRRRALGLPSPSRSLETVAEQFLDRRRETVERATWSADRTAMHHLLEAFPGRTIREVTTDDLQHWTDSMLRRGYARNTLDAYRRTMRVFFRWAGEHNPADDVELPNPGTHDVRWWSDAEVKRLRTAANKVDAQKTGNFASCRLALEVGLSMGLRQSEIFGLRWEDIRESEKVVRVDRQTIKDRPGTKPLKGKLSRTALIIPDWWEHHRRAMGWMFAKPNADEPLGYRTQRNMITRVLDTAGLNEVGVGFHSLRHTYAARYLLMRGSLFGLQKSLGHSSITVTQSAYEHLASDAVAEVERRHLYGS